jgi:hypothetical protein
MPKSKPSPSKSESHSDLERFKLGVSRMSTRTFGEKFAEELVRMLVEHCKRPKPNGGKCDLVEHETNVEVKFSRQFARGSVTKDSPPLDHILNAAGKRFKPACEFSEANFQKIHLNQFDILYFGIVFDDCVVIYRAEKNELKFNKQHRGVKRIKQFTISNLSKYEEFLVAKLDWPDVYEYFRT